MNEITFANPGSTRRSSARKAMSCRIAFLLVLLSVAAASAKMLLSTTTPLL